ncbi:Ribokinase-like protein [Lineolata rhizophorae]|uniref:Ribokinase-like protein n=1 Tax=Lineolata rhizophorae TaxID=578093 RepID=A0A6A6NWV1_9PEZI|nr:Ribokinase-like protein [Lineolata rhizophorae]
MASNDEDAPAVRVDFVTLGMFIIDEIHFLPPRPPVRDIVGGAGTYAALGARVLSPPPLSRTVGWIVDCGSDFPAPLRSLIQSWDTACLMRETPERYTTRGWNGYSDHDHRVPQKAFTYTTPKLRLDQNSLTPTLLRSRSFHIICSPERCIDMSTGIRNRLDELPAPVEHQPLFVWEPVPDLCEADELDNCLRALRYVDVVSANHEELCAFFGRKAIREEDGSLDRPIVEWCCSVLLGSGVGADKKGAVVIRAGKEGCYVATREKNYWLPAFHKDGSEKVVDPTGGGNAFLGGLCVGLVRYGEGSGKARPVLSIHDASVLANVAASFAIEQVGPPTLGKAEDGTETWNGVVVEERVKEYRQGLAGLGYVQ